MRSRHKVDAEHTSIHCRRQGHAQLRGASPPARLYPVKAPAYTVKALDETTWQPFAALVERNNGIFGGCWCMGFHPKDAGQGPATAVLNRERKLNRVRAGTAHAALVFDETIASAGASSASRTRYRGSRTAPQPRRDRSGRRTGGSRAATWARGTAGRVYTRQPWLARST
jgi:hypothetical protein